MSRRGWGVVGAVAAAGVLVLPVAGLLWTRAAPAELGGWRRMPMLTGEEFLARESFLRECKRSADCEPPLVCFWDHLRDKNVCTSSDCRSDSDCLPGTACRWIPSGEEGTRVALGLCNFEGTRREGESCFRRPKRSEKGCEPGLVCADWCARRCGSWFDPGCPEGFFCAEGGPDGPVCLPTCEGRACPEGQACVRVEGGVSVCARVHGPDCQREPCAQGQECRVTTTPHRRGEAWMRCARPCTATGPDDRSKDCSEFQYCVGGECQDWCMDTQAGCGPDAYCVPLHGEVGACILSPEPLDDGI